MGGKYMDWRTKVNTAGKSDSDFQSNKDWIRKMNNAVAYIESNLDGTIDYNEAAKIACCSIYHFQRFFSFIAEVPLSEYIRRRRLTLAAFELQNNNVRVIDVALKYGYESPEAFARAFKGIHGVAPTAARDKGSQLKAYPCMVFHISIKGDAEMNYRIEKKEAFGFFGVDTEISTVDNQNYVSIPKFWETCRLDGTITRIRKAGILNENTPLHAAMYNCTDTSHAYMIGHFVPASGAPEGFNTLTVPASTWAVFPTEELSMAEAAQQAAIMWKSIFTEWFATSGYELANTPELELHYKKCNDKYVTEIWIPIEKSNKA
jgi:AraC family transcriptional regulator